MAERVGAAEATRPVEAARMQLFSPIYRQATMQDYIQNVGRAWVRAMSNGEEVSYGDAF